MNPKIRGQIRSFLLLSIHFLTAACSGSVNDRSETSVRDSAGVTIVENVIDRASVPLFAEIDPTPLAEIGVVSGNPEQEFGRISDADLLQIDRILVADGQARELLLFDFSGTLLRRRGGQGGGPDEFGSFGAVQVTAGDSIRVFDRTNRRIAVLHPDSDSIFAAPFRELRNTRPSTVGFFPDGRMVVSLSASAGGTPTSSELTMSRDTLALVLADPEGVELSDFGTFLGTESVEKASQEGNIFRTMFATVPFTRFSEWVPTGQGLLVGTSDRFEFKMFDGDGVLRRIFRIHGAGFPGPGLRPFRVHLGWGIQTQTGTQGILVRVQRDRGTARPGGRPGRVGDPRRPGRPDSTPTFT